MTVSAAIAAEATAYTITRPTAPTMTKGIVTPGVPATTSVTMWVQPANPKEIMVLPEGFRNRQIVRVHALAELRTSDQTSGVGGDRFAYNGATYEVIQVQDWTTEGGFYRAFAARLQG